MLTPADYSHFKSRNDSEDLRIGDLISISQDSVLANIELTIKKQKANSFCFLGYPDDEGISLNGGRPGAKLGPSYIRKYLSRMTPANLNTINLAATDLGDISLQGELSSRHQIASDLAELVLKNNQRLISFGGGHDYGFSDGAAFLNSYKGNVKPLVINFDAHLDVRPTDKGFHSGTPFRRLLEKYHGQFDFIEIGIQDQCNSPHHRRWAEEQGVHIIPWEKLQGTPLEQTLPQILIEQTDLTVKRPVYLSIDIDGFSSSVAPGASQSWPQGFTANDFFSFFSWLMQTVDIRVLGIYEVSPPLDVDDRTSRLAALIAYRFMMAN